MSGFHYVLSFVPLLRKTTAPANPALCRYLQHNKIVEFNSSISLRNVSSFFAVERQSNHFFFFSSNLLQITRVIYALSI